MKFTCKPAVTEKQQYWTRNYASVSGNYHMDPKEVEKAVTYSCFFEMDGREDNVVVHLNARAVCPMIKLSHTILDFGECAVNERKDFLFSIDNKNPNHPVPLEFSKVMLEKSTCLIHYNHHYQHRFLNTIPFRNLARLWVENSLQPPLLLSPITSANSLTILKSSSSVPMSSQ